MNNLDYFYFYYYKSENKIFIDSKNSILDSSIYISHNDNVVYCSPMNFNKNILWVQPFTNLYNLNNIKIELRDINNNVLRQEFMTLQKEEEPENENIKYISGGLLGDFINQLSIIKENYLLTGKKGDVYLLYTTSLIPNSEFAIGNFDTFAFGVVKAYEDLKDIVLKQEYISSFQIYKGEIFKNYINLSKWRIDPDLEKINIYELYKKNYNVEWGSHKWIDLPYENMYEDCILITTSEKKFNYDFNFNYLKKYDKKIFYATTNINEYKHFKDKTDCDYNMIYFDNLYDYWIAINSCYLFATTFSSYLVFANAIHRNTISLLPTHYNIDKITYYKNISGNKWFDTEKENNLKDYDTMG